MVVDSYNEALTIAVLGIAKKVKKIHDKDFIANIKMYIKRHLPVTPKKQLVKRIECPNAPLRGKSVRKLQL
jgi:hypothetical protein